MKVFYLILYSIKFQTVISEKELKFIVREIPAQANCYSLELLVQFVEASIPYISPNLASINRIHETVRCTIEIIRKILHVAKASNNTKSTWCMNIYLIVQYIEKGSSN